MLRLSKKKEETAHPSSGALISRDLSEYIPYYSHMNANTLLTKNGEVLQTFRIRYNQNGLGYESGKSDDDSVREHVRAAISDAVTSTDYTLWIHTLRTRKPVKHTDTFSQPFATYVRSEWQKAHPWKFQYHNEIYITLLYNGQGADLFDKRRGVRSYSRKSNRALRNNYLERSAQSLEQTVNAIMEKLRTHYRVERLSIVERQGIYYSELMEFFGNLINLSQDPFPVRESDVSKDMANHQLLFGFNALEAKSARAQRFAAILSLKQYREVPPAAADRLLQMPVECIISQSFIFTSAKRALKDYTMQKGVFLVSGDNYSPLASGLEEMLSSDHGRSTDFGSSQTTIAVISDTYKALDPQVIQVQAAFGEMGLIAIREDVKMEECFWAQLPGNFNFINRIDMIPTDYIGGFVRLNLFPDGLDNGNHWGSALALVPTQVNSPYFFNLHVNDNGHTVLFDFNPFKDNAAQILTNFIVTSATKYRGRILVFDRAKSAHLLMSKLNGLYYRPLTANARHPLKLNPFLLEDNKRNKGFLSAWVSMLIGQAATTAEARSAIELAIERLYNDSPRARNLDELAVYLRHASATPLADALSPYIGNGKYAELFNSETETLDLTSALCAFDMDPIAKQQDCLVPLFAYLMHRIILSLDGQPTLIVLHEAFTLLENAFFIPRFESLLDILTQNNAALFITTQKPADCVKSSTFATLINKAATQIYMPDDVTPDYAIELPILEEFDNKLMIRMDRNRGDFLVKHKHESIAIRIDLREMEAIRAVFANDVKTLIAAGGPFATLPDERIT